MSQMLEELPEVLFVCVHNAGGSQMAAGRVKLRCAGRRIRDEIDARVRTLVGELLV